MEVRETKDKFVAPALQVNEVFVHSAERMDEPPSNSVAPMVTPRREIQHGCVICVSASTLGGMTQTARRTKRAEALDLLLGPQPVDIVVDGAVVHLPDDLREVLREAAGLASRGVEVAVVASDRTLSTGEAADMLGVSRAYLVELLNAGAIPFQRPAGSHRRLLMGDVVKYQACRRADRGAALAELAATEADADIPYS